MFTVTFKNYRNDYDKYLETKNFASLEDLTKYVQAERKKRYDTPRHSKYWYNPICVPNKKAGLVGWIDTGRSASTYSMWLEKVEYDGVIIFEKGNYCSPKFGEYLQQLHDQFEEKPVYGDF